MNVNNLDQSNFVSGHTAYISRVTCNCRLSQKLGNSGVRYLGFGRRRQDEILKASRWDAEGVNRGIGYLLPKWPWNLGCVVSSPAGSGAELRPQTFFSVEFEGQKRTWWHAFKWISDFTEHIPALTAIKHPAAFRLSSSGRDLIPYCIWSFNVPNVPVLFAVTAWSCTWTLVLVVTF